MTPSMPSAHHSAPAGVPRSTLPSCRSQSHSLRSPRRTLSKLTGAASSGCGLSPVRTARSRHDGRRPPVLQAARLHQAPVVLATEAISAEELKTALISALDGIDRGIFGVQTAKRTEIHGLVEQLEAINPQPAPMDDLACVAGKWRVLYSTIKITGSKRTKLGLREFVKISDMLQIIDIEECTAANVVEFSVMGLGTFSGNLTISAKYEKASANRVNIAFDESTLVPSQLQKIFEKNYDMLLGIFNPEGYLDITYVDATHRLGRDDKGNIFILERISSEAA